MPDEFKATYHQYYRNRIEDVDDDHRAKFMGSKGEEPANEPGEEMARDLEEKERQKKEKEEKPPTKRSKKEEA